MRRLLVAVSIVLALAAGVVGPAAQAGDGYWTATRCYSEVPFKGLWFGEKTMGVWFRSVWGQHGVSGRIYPAHVALGAECSFGFPLTEAVRGSGLTAQYFVLPYSCALNYIVAWDNGGTQAFSIPNYFC